MPIQDENLVDNEAPETTAKASAPTAEDAGLSPTPDDGLSQRGVVAGEIGISGNDPNSNATNANADDVLQRQSNEAEQMLDDGT